MRERIGYVGLGNLGVHLAASLLKAGHEVVVTDLHRDAADRLVEAGARWADTAAAVAAQATVVFTCLPSPAAVDAVLCGSKGILEGFAPGSTWIDNSTNDRAETLRLAARCADAGVEMLECPVTGGVHKAAEGDITFLVGGEQSLFERHRHLLEAMGRPILYMGPIGNAAIIKVITNMLAF